MVSHVQPPGSSIHGILQARILEWVAIPFYSRSSQPRDWTQVSYTEGRFFTVWATREAQPSDLLIEMVAPFLRSVNFESVRLTVLCGFCPAQLCFSSMEGGFWLEPFPPSTKTFPDPLSQPFQPWQLASLPPSESLTKHWEWLFAELAVCDLRTREPTSL